MSPGPAPAAGWAALTGRRVGVWGLGVEGRATLRRLARLGAYAVVVDDAAAPGATGPGGEAVTATAQGGLDLLLGCEVVVKSPGISRYRPDVGRLVEAGVPVRGGLGLWLEDVDRRRVLAVTGTKGKSTTTSVAGGLLRGLVGPAVRTGGNLGVPPWDPDLPAGTGAGDGWWVVEVSSYQATDVTTGPPVVCVTSLSQDHLDWHGSPAAYYRDKLSLCTRPGVQVVVADGSSALLREHADLLGPRVDWVTDDERADPPPWVSRLGLLGRHNVRNALVAQRAVALMGVAGADDPARLAAAATGFEALPSRLTPLGEVSGVLFVDDSLSTNVLPTLSAVEAFAGRRLALLVGGFERGIDYRPLGAGLAGRPDTLVLTLPDNGPAIGAVLRPYGIEVVDCDSLEAAVDRALAAAWPDGVVLLSPAAPAFGQYADYRAKAVAFRAAFESRQRPPS